jgi:hypothetical protein
VRLLDGAARVPADPGLRLSAAAGGAARAAAAAAADWGATASDTDVALWARRRLQILVALSLRPHHLARTGSLHDELQGMGFPMTLTRFMVEVAFLADLGLVEAPDEGYVGLTDDGLAVALGHVKLPGVGHPALGER